MVTFRFWMRCVSFIVWLGIVGLFLYWPLLHLTSSGAKSLTVFAWPGMFDAHAVESFEKETGIKVHLSYYETNEELMLKLGNGKGYDLIVPSDYTVRRLRQKGLIKKLDKSKLPISSSINPLFLSHYYDVHNEYTIPIEWAVFGIGFNRKCLSTDTHLSDSWSIIFDSAILKKMPLVMTNDPYVAIPIASLYVSEGRDAEATNHLDTIEKILARQRPWVVAYSDYRADYFLVSKNACLAVVSSSALIRSMSNDSSIDFIIPREGTLITIESFAIPAMSTKEDLAYAFINFMMAPDQVASRYKDLGFFPTTIEAARTLKMHPRVHSLLSLPSTEFFEKFHLLRYDVLRSVLSDQELQDLWVRVKV